jgi:peptide chain release factor 2
MRDIKEDVSALKQRFGEAQKFMHYDELSERMKTLEVEVAQSDLWDDPENAKKVNQEYSQVSEDLKLLDTLGQNIADIETLFELGTEESDDSVEKEIESQLAAVNKEFDSLELRALFSGEFDERDAVCELHAGAGGTEAQDWTEMLLRMYGRWAERRNFAFEVDDVTPGTEAGILSATFIVKGRFAYGLLKAERGTHRLVRISPFDSNARRHTSFASLDVLPFFEEPPSEIDIDEADLRIDTFRSSGAGGQHVNKTDSAIRITHIPTGIVVACQNERSQHQNRARAMQILAAKLVERNRQEREAELAAIGGKKTQVAWGTQIRSYVMAPYQLVKDLRTDYETGNVQAVLDGDLDEFMESFLRWNRARQS